MMHGQKNIVISWTSEYLAHGVYWSF